jgi:hypothetical protein
VRLGAILGERLLAEARFLCGSFVPLLMWAATMAA